MIGYVLKSALKMPATSFSMSKVFPRCKKDFAGVYVNASGDVFPCCWIGNLPDLKQYFEFHGLNLVSLNVGKKKLEEIIVSGVFNEIENTWETAAPFAPCLKHCGKPEPTNLDQYRGSNQEIVIKLFQESEE